MTEAIKPDAPSTEIGEYRPASRLREGWHLTRHGVWTEITGVVQVTSPVRIAMLTLGDGTSANVPHTHEVLCRTAAEIKRAADVPAEAAR
jgi:hypothetical protein